MIDYNKEVKRYTDFGVRVGCCGISMSVGVIIALECGITGLPAIVAVSLLGFMVYCFVAIIQHDSVEEEPERVRELTDTAEAVADEYTGLKNADRFRREDAELSVLDAALKWHRLDTSVNAEALHHYCAELARLRVK